MKTKKSPEEKAKNVSTVTGRTSHEDVKKTPTKPPTIFDLKIEISKAERERDRSVAVVRNDATEDDKKARTEATVAVLPLGEARDIAVKALGAARLRAHHAAVVARDEAVRRAHGDHQKAVAEADRLFNEERDRAGAAMREKTAPKLLERQAEIKSRLDNELHELANAHSDQVAPLLVQLRTLEAAAAAVAKQAAEAATSAPAAEAQS